MDHDEERIRQRAYAIWVAEGYPDGCDQKHWQQACDEFSAASADSAGSGDQDAMTDLAMSDDSIQPQGNAQNGDAQQGKASKRMPLASKGLRNSDSAI